MRDAFRLKDLTPEDLPGDLQDIAHLVGMETALMLSIKLGGSQLYIPKRLNVDKQRRNREIRDEYDKGGVTIKALARKHRLTERQVYNILSRRSRGGSKG